MNRLQAMISGSISTFVVCLIFTFLSLNLAFILITEDNSLFSHHNKGVKAQ